MNTISASVFCFLLTIAPTDHCVIKETYGTFSKDDLDKLIEYSVNQEIQLLQKMLDQKRVITLKKGTKVILVDVGLLKTVIRIPNNEIKIWVVTESIGDCN